MCVLVIRARGNVSSEVGSKCTVQAAAIPWINTASTQYSISERTVSGIKLRQIQGLAQCIKILLQAFVDLDTWGLDSEASCWIGFIYSSLKTCDTAISEAEEFGKTKTSTRMSEKWTLPYHFHMTDAIMGTKSLNAKAAGGRDSGPNQRTSAQSEREDKSLSQLIFCQWVKLIH